MAEIISIDPIEKSPTPNLIKKALQYFKALDRYVKLMVITLGLIIISTPFIIANRQTFISKGQEANPLIIAAPLTTGSYNLPSGQGANTAIATTSAVTIGANKLALIWITQGNGTAGPASLSDPNRTWTQIATNTPRVGRLTLYRSMNSVDTTGVITITSLAPTVSKDVVNGIAWSLVKYSNTDVSGVNGSGAIAQFASRNFRDAGGSLLSGSVTLQPSNIVGSAVGGGFAMGPSSSVFPGAGYALTGGNPCSGLCIQAEFRDNFAQLVDMSWTSSTQWMVIAAELKPLSGVTPTPTPPTTPPTPTPTPGPISSPTPTPPTPTPGPITVLKKSEATCGVGCKVYTLGVTCQNLIERIILMEERGQGSKGTIFFTLGGFGTGYYPDAIPEYARSQGFQTYRIKWDGSYGFGTGVGGAGFKKAMCGYAEVVKWVKDKNIASNSDVMCATGNSGGSLQIGHGLSLYGLEDYLDMVILTGGPPNRWDIACFNVGDPGYFSNNARSRDIVDYMLGGKYCATGDGSNPAVVKQFQDDSLTSPTEFRDYSFSTKVNFVQSVEDSFNVYSHAKMYYDHITSSKGWYDIPGKEHEVYSTTDGSAKMKELFVSECK